MIYGGSGDRRKGLLGYSSSAEMEETELEEGEACSCHNDDDPSIDPDVALSYIDEKLQNVLGHFQKDFEGGVSAENLGAKFGGYGSFLPTYQRSPVWSRSRTSPKALNSNTPRSPNCLHVEGGRHNFEVPSSASLCVRQEHASTTASFLPSVRASVNDPAKVEVGISSAQCAEESTSRCELGINSAQSSDHKTLKVRIKVGSENLSTQKNAEIYSGLGLDVSPSLSLDGSPSNSDGTSHEPQYDPDESPTSILQIMTSMPVQGNILLSPLPDALIYLDEKGKLHSEIKPGYLQKGGQDNSHGSGSDRSIDKVLGHGKPESFEKNACSAEVKNLNDKDIRNGIGVLLKKETEIDSSACEELIANALKLPLLSNAYSGVVDTAEGTDRAVEKFRAINDVKEGSFSNFAKDEPLEAVPIMEIALVEKRNGSTASAGNLWEDKEANFQSDILVYPRKGCNFKGENASPKADSNVSKSTKAQNEPVDPLVRKYKASTFVEEDAQQLTYGKEHSFSGGKKKLKGSQSYKAQGAEASKDNSRVESSLMPKDGRSTYAKNYLSKNEIENSKLQNSNDKARNRYTDFFGDIEPKEGDNDAYSSERLSIDRPKNSERVEINTFASNSTLMEMLIHKNVGKPSISEAYSKVASNAGPITGNGPTSNAAPGTFGPLVKEDWVCCDKCQKWRLLPLGMNPDSLPEKWLCSMLDWLPGMNRCSISEEETTKALIALYQVPGPVNQNNHHGNPGSVLPGMSLADACCFNQNRQNLGFHAASSGGKKKDEIKDASAAMNQPGPAKFSDSKKKNLQASVKHGSLNGVNQSPLANGIVHMHVSKPNVEKHKDKQHEKSKLLEQHDEGETRSSKIKGKGNPAENHLKISKRSKVDGLHYTDEDRISDHSGPVGKLGPSVNSGLSVNVSAGDRHKYIHHSPKHGKCEVNNSSKGPPRNLDNQVQVTSDDGSQHVEKVGGKDVARKRKRNGTQDKNVDGMEFLEQTSENIHRKEKKSRVSRSEGKEMSTSKGSGGASKKVKSTKDKQLEKDMGRTPSHRSLDAMDTFKRDLGSVRPPQAATSSSSKISGSHKNKTYMQDTKGSPVESVSSSPVRFSNPDKSMSERNVEGKDDFGDAGFYAPAAPRRCSDGEDDKGSNRPGIVRKDAKFVAHQGSLESVLDFQERDMGDLAGSKAKTQTIHSHELANHYFTDGGTDTLGTCAQYPCKPETSDQWHDDERSDKQFQANVSLPRKPENESSLRFKEKGGSSKSELNKGKVRVSDSCNESTDHAPCYEESSRAGKSRVQDKFVVTCGKVEKSFVGKKDSAGKGASKSSKRESRSKFGETDSSDDRIDALSRTDQKRNLLLERDEGSSRKHLSDKTDQVEAPGRGKLHPLPPPPGRGQSEMVTHSLCSNSGGNRENGRNTSLVDASSGDDASNAPEQIKKTENQNGRQPIRSRHATINGHKVGDADDSNPIRRDSFSQDAANAIKEAKDLKHLADRLKNSGSNAESTGLYFQAALKFLHGASLLESSNCEGTKPGEMIQSRQMYSSTAKLCEFCAHEYEKSKDMAAAALAYKCMEVAYMRVIYSSHASANRDRHELHTALQLVPPGESPSSSASDVDNLNNPISVDKLPLAKGVSSPQVAGNHVIAARNRPCFMRLLNFAQDVNFAMDASKKSRTAFAVANPRMQEPQIREGIRSVKRALDFNFQDVEGLLRMVRLAMEAISR